MSPLEPRRNACFDRPPFRTSMVVQDGWWMDGYTRYPKMKAVEFRGSPGCVYSTDPLMGSKDPGCVGCKWRGGAVPL